MISQTNTIYIYTDYQEDEDNNPIAGLKIGNGNAYLGDLPFLDTLYLNHINNTDIHITAAERQKWNEKVTCFPSLMDEEMVIFTKD